MPHEPQLDISGMLHSWMSGDAAALDNLVEHVYPEMRRIARHHLLCRRAAASIESAALANEAYVKLARAGAIHCDSRLHFLALCSQIMRRILVDHCRTRRAEKRGRNQVFVSLDDIIVGAKERGVDIMALDEALQGLERLDPRKSRVIELRYFGGLTIEEAADVLGVSAETAKRDWRIAKAWLLDALSSAPGRKAPVGKWVST